MIRDGRLPRPDIELKGVGEQEPVSGYSMESIRIIKALMKRR
jgi:hypothetical protein